MVQQLRRIAVLNRGEAATRCLRAIRELRGEDGSDLAGIALYTEPDRAAPFVREADEAIFLGPALREAEDGSRRPAYLDPDRVLAGIRASRADAVWPGWGFLAEDAAFVARLEAMGLIFIGPSARTIELLGDKMTAKRLATTTGVPVAPWSDGPVDREQLLSVATRIGLPVMIKAVAGGGGRGIRKVSSADALEDAFNSAGVEAAHAFGDGTLFLEACVKDARHVEVQIAADLHGEVLALGLRDCSVQRRHQKIVEEAPPPELDESTVRQMRDAAIRLAREAGYSGVGTCEFLVTSDQRFYFLEVNPRLQVEHGITEVLTGFDLVKWQIRMARGEQLPAVAPMERGHAIEVRVCAEDPSNDFAPSPGNISLFELPSGPGVRVDSGVSSHGAIPAEFDSMVAKVIALGANRAEAIARLERAVSDLRVVIEGGMVNKGFLLDILSHPEFRKGSVHTGWLDRARLATEPRPRIQALIVAAILTYQREREGVRTGFFSEASRGRPRKIPPSTGVEIDLGHGGRSYRLRVFAIGAWAYRVHLGSDVCEVSLIEQGPHTRQLLMGGRRFAVLFSESDIELRIEIDGRLHRVNRDLGGRIRAPAPALVIEVSVSPGDRVVAGQRLALLEAMKTETAVFAPLPGTVRQVGVRAGERVAAGDVILVIEPSADQVSAKPQGKSLEFEIEKDPLDAFFASGDDEPDLLRASKRASAVRAAAVGALRSETRRIFMGYDVNSERADRLVQVLESSVHGIPQVFRFELAQVARGIEIFTDVETLFSRSPTRLEGDELGPSNDARIAMYLRRIGVEGAGIAPVFLSQLERALRHYGVQSLRPNDALFRAVLRLFATRTTLELRGRLIVALLHLTIRLGEHAEPFARYPEVEGALDRLGMLRGTVSASIADLAAQARFLLFERPRESAPPASAQSPVELGPTLVPPPDPARLDELAKEAGLLTEDALRIELWRLDRFELERVETFEGIHALYGRARDGSGDERLFCFAEVTDLGPGVPERPDLAIFAQRFHEAIEALRLIQGARDPGHRLQWNRLYLFVRPVIDLTPELLQEAVRRLSPETAHLGLEKVVVRLAAVSPDHPSGTKKLEAIVGNPTGGRVEASLREPHLEPLATATPYERRVSASRARGLVYPYETVRLFTAPPSDSENGDAGAKIGAGTFQEYELVDSRVQPVDRPYGQNTSGVVVGMISTPMRKYPEGVRRVLIVGDPTYGMGALALPECERIVAAINLAEEEGIPVEWVAVSSGARIAMESGTENLDATARVVRRIVTFTDAGGEINLIVPGVNVGAQSYFDALATMGLQTRGVLIMLASGSMVLTGRAALEFSGGVAAEDEVGIGGYERIMGPSGQAQYQARDLADAYRVLLAHYGCSYRAPGESHPRRFDTEDPSDRDVTAFPYEGEEGFEVVGEIFSPESNPGRKRPFGMRPLMRALADQDAGSLERWRDWVAAETAIVWDCHIGGFPVALIGIESRPIDRTGHAPNDGPETWTAGTLFPMSSKKVARALNAASGNRAAVILANLSGFDGSPESMRRGILEFGAEIARAVVRFRGPLLFTVVSRYHGGAYVVFSRQLNPEMRATALSGSYASVIGGAAAAVVVFPREVRKRANADPRVRSATARVAAASDPASRAANRAELDRILDQVLLEKRAELAAQFDAVHTVERAREVGSLDALLEPRDLRPALIAMLLEAANSTA